MIVLGTGITGSGRASYLSSTVEYSMVQGIPSELRDIGPEMFNKAASLRISIPNDKILDLDEMALRFLRAAVFESLVHDVGKYRDMGESSSDLYISLHMSFRWRKFLMHAFDYHYLVQVNPDILLTVIDSVGCIVKRIYNDDSLAHWRDRLSIRELLIWQDEEIFITKMVADILDKHFYIIPSSSAGPCTHDPKMLFNIIHMYEKPLMMGEKPIMRRAYLSYPMTHVKKEEEFMERKEEFIEILRENNIIVFDPIMVEDHVLIDKMKSQEGDTIYIDMFDIEVPRKEVVDAEEYIVDSTVNRDLLFIDQSDMVIVFYPTNKLSPGVLSEMNYGFTHMKRVYTLFTEDDISPFFRSHSNYITKDPDKLVKKIREDFNI